ncbi:MAG: sigma 54-interacting transcriptional regulator [Deltaproteobacteria bacterium]|nr:sigma 54-interacting transcriptional regulator [Deltaproteobacteria bacterium]MCW5808455.1 sigma 54-interacting transcriptional regulator [Deltaproteobacteria bacterium]
MVIGLRAMNDGVEHLLDPSSRRWLVGSRSDCDVVIEDPYVSAHHCVLERRPGGVLVVRDRNSRNGTKVDGNIIEGAELRVGSYLTLGRTTLIAIGAPGGDRKRAIEEMRGHDPAFRAMVEQALRAASTDCNVLIVGETGTGKDLLARVVHEASRRASGKFVAVNCGGIPRELIGSELFGHEKGSFTGAHADRDGYFVEANCGTLFLDELGELPLELQPHLLRAIESRHVRRVGGASERQVDVRLIAATNRLDGLGTESSRLRLDLYHRVATVVLVVPPLRERMGDLVELVNSMLLELSVEYGTKQVNEEGWKALAGYAWPGNVRELRHAVSRAVALGGESLGAADFFSQLRFGHRTPDGVAVPDGDPGLVPYQSMMRGAMEQALTTHGTIRAAASQLGMAKSTFADKARAWGLLPRRLPKPSRFKMPKPEAK